MKQEEKQISSKYALKKKAKRWVVFADKETIKDNFYGTYQKCYALILGKYPDVESPETMIHRRTL